MTNKENTTVVRRVFAACRQKQKAVAAAPADNAIAAMTTELRHDPAGNLDLLAIVAATGPAMTPIDTPATLGSSRGATTRNRHTVPRSEEM